MVAASAAEVQGVGRCGIAEPSTGVVARGGCATTAVASESQEDDDDVQTEEIGRIVDVSFRGAEEIGRIVDVSFRGAEEAGADAESSPALPNIAASAIHGAVRVRMREIYTLPSGRGTILWKAAKMMGRWMVARPEIVAGRGVIEIGAGCGLSGLTALALGARSVVLTDAVPSVLENLAANAAAGAAAVAGRTASVARFDFCEGAADGVEAELRALARRRPAGAEVDLEVLLASDVLYTWDKVRGLRRTVAGFFASGGRLAVIFSHEGSAAANTQSKVAEVADALRSPQVGVAAFWDEAAMSPEGGATVLLCWPMLQDGGAQLPAGLDETISTDSPFVAMSKVASDVEHLWTLYKKSQHVDLTAMD